MSNFTIYFCLIDLFISLILIVISFFVGKSLGKKSGENLLKDAEILAEKKINEKKKRNEKNDAIISHLYDNIRDGMSKENN